MKQNCIDRRSGQIPVFDNHDDRIPYYELLLERDSLEKLPVYPLPQDYRFVFYRHGDRDAWIEIEKSAKEFSSYRQGLTAWNRYYADREEELCERMLFIERADGKKIATATAFYDRCGCEETDAGCLHWVAVCREEQGKGLSRPLIVRALQVMRSFGYTHVKIPTQTTTWVACKIYLDFGFVPVAQNAVSSRRGWQIIKTLTNHPSLSDFDEIPLSEIVKNSMSG